MVYSNTGISTSLTFVWSHPATFIHSNIFARLLKRKGHNVWTSGIFGSQSYWKDVYSQKGGRRTHRYLRLGRFLKASLSMCFRLFALRSSLEGKKAHSLEAENLSTRASVHHGHCEASEQDREHANVEAKWKPGGDGQDQKSPIRVFSARTASQSESCGAVKHALSPSSTRLGSRRMGPGQLKRRAGDVHHPLLLHKDYRGSLKALLWTINHYTESSLLMDYKMVGLEFSKSNKHVLEVQMLEIPSLWFHADAWYFSSPEVAGFLVDKEKLVLLNLCPTTVLIVLRAPRIQTQKNAGPPPKRQPRAAPAWPRPGRRKAEPGVCVIQRTYFRWVGDRRSPVFNDFFSHVHNKKLPVSDPTAGPLFSAEVYSKIILIFVPNIFLIHGVNRCCCRWRRRAATT